MEFETERTELGVREFYHTYRKQLPKIVMVNQGFYDDSGNDTFSREQVLRLHRTSRRKRVLVESYVGRVKKSYSMSINYPEKFCVEDPNVKGGSDQTLLEIVRKHTLPVRVRLSRDRTILVNGQHVKTNSLPDMNLIQTFDEISFLGNDIDKGVMSSEIIKIPLCLEKVMFTIVTGIAGQSKRQWQEFTAMWTNESGDVDYSQEQGTEDIAQYKEDQVTTETRVDRLEPVNYTNLMLLLPNRNTVSRDPPRPPPPASNDDTYETFDNIPTRNNKPGVTSLMKEMKDAVLKKGKKDKKKTVATTNPPAELLDSTSPPTSVTALRTGTKPKTAPKPALKATTLPTSGSSKLMLCREKSKSYEGQTMSKPNVLGRTTSVKEPKTKQPTEPVRKVYDPELDYDIAVPTAGMKAFYQNSQGDIDDYFEPSHDEIDYSEPNGSATANPSTGVYTNTSQMAVIKPINNMGDDDTYMYVNHSDLNQKQDINKPPSIRKETETRASTRLERATNKLSMDEITKLSVDEVCDYLKLLNIDGVIDAFREERIDGVMLQQLTADLLKDEFNLTALQILRLRNFVNKGHIPK